MEHFIGYDSVKNFLGKIMTTHLLGLGKVSSAIERQKENEVTEHASSCDTIWVFEANDFIIEFETQELKYAWVL